MLILSRVCAEFRDASGAVLFRVTPQNRFTFLEAPDAIRRDPLFSLMVSEGSLEAVVSAARKRALENDPAADTDAAGRRAPEEGNAGKAPPEGETKSVRAKKA